MTIPDEIRDCVAFVGCTHKKDNDFILLGTTFFVRMDVFDEQVPALYAITARHVVEDAKTLGVGDQIVLQINDCQKGIRRIPFDYSEWFFHKWDETVDVAVLPLMGVDIDFDQKFFPVNRFALGDILAKAKIRLGEEIFVTGLFDGHSGTKRNIPIVRVGNIATLLGEKITTVNFRRDSIDVEGYLIESRSIGGLSGSPVFAVIDEPTPNSQNISTMPASLTYANGWLSPAHTYVDPVSAIQRHYCLMGLLHGHYDIPNATPVFANGERMPLNMGIAIVIPAAKINDVLFHPKLESERAAMFKAVKASKSFTINGALPNQE